jgi:hypothetical protein
MSSTNYIDYLKYSSEQILIYLGFFVLITGLIGNVFNIIIYTSLRTFRETTCAFYLTVASFVNIFELLAGLLSRICSYVYGIDATENSVFFCKIRSPVLIASTLISVTCMSFDNTFTLIYILYYIYSSSSTFTDPVDAARDQLTYLIVVVLYYLVFAVRRFLLIRKK